MKILVTGCNGFLGSNLMRVLGQKFEMFGTDLRASSVIEMRNIAIGDQQDLNFVVNIINEFCPDVVINTVALADVDRCESEPEIARKLNVETVHNISKVCASQNVRLVHISTDHLFDGTKSFCSEIDKPCPVNVYAVTKLEGEQIVNKYIPGAIIVRTNFFGWSPSGHKPTFAEWLYKSLCEQKEISLFDDFYFTPIEVTYFAETLGRLIELDFRGIINIVGSQRCSKYEFGIEMAREFNLSFDFVKKDKMQTASFLIKRPHDLSLNNEKLKALIGENSLPDIVTSLRKMKENKPKTETKV